MFFYVTFFKDVIIICLFSFSNSVIKFVSKCYVVLFVNVIGILSERFVEFTFCFTMSKVHQSFFGMLDFGDFLRKGKQ